MNIREALNSAADQLRTRADIAEWASRDANLLLQHVLGITRAQALAYPERELTAEQAASYSELIEQRLAASPIQHLTGKQEFYGRSFRVSPDVLIPRPETELIIDEVLARIGRDAARKSDHAITDVGTGSGILAVTLACELPNARITALDISPAALAVARANAAQHCVDARITFLESDLLAGITEPQDIIVSNPPYIGRDESDTMHAQVIDHEPALALFAEDHGDAIYQRLIPQAWEKLKPSGTLIMELGTQGQRLNPLFTLWCGLRYARDLQGIERVVVAHKPS